MMCESKYSGDDVKWHDTCTTERVTEDKLTLHLTQHSDHHVTVTLGAESGASAGVDDAAGGQTHQRIPGSRQKGAE